MDLGIRGKKAIVCASSKGLGKGCAMALAEAGCDLVVNGRNAELVAKTAAEMRERYGVKVIEIVGDVVESRGAEGAARRLPRPGHSGQQQWRPAACAISANSTAQAILEGVTKTW